LFLALILKFHLFTGGNYFTPIKIKIAFALVVVFLVVYLVILNLGNKNKPQKDKKI
jgi:hypothetical protein